MSRLMSKIKNKNLKIKNVEVRALENQDSFTISID